MFDFLVSNIGYFLLHNCFSTIFINTATYITVSCGFYDNGTVIEDDDLLCYKYHRHNILNINDP